MCEYSDKLGSTHHQLRSECGLFRSVVDVKANDHIPLDRCPNAVFA
jgi:hypothetical protein